ncbi:DUF928 domain-containing protein [Nostoc punctiforme FACHB-252]|uniref:DUF928 domain-containing protein n=1 Tax=Nostoc punctiforme FACHB-252 TaxID=1357509 RepID=A0ABR8H4B8_NOSPU|nr:DUF928 domain-containing protein [Nostoc punctiforme]MBD2610071.1 DUF928 domain-containing protein [Nostoc punctiforme FACHB-252]
MTKINFRFPQILVFSLTFIVVSFTQPAQPQQPPNNNSNSTKIRFIQPTLEKEPENRGAPGDRQGAGTRGDCPNVSKPLTALVPLIPRTLSLKQQTTTDKPLSKFVLGLTTAEYPTFWFYVPYQIKDIDVVKFVVLDENNNSITKEPLLINLSRTPGVISVRVPTTEKPLEIGKYYHWYFLIDCKSQTSSEESEDIAVEGLVQRIEPNPDLVRRLGTATPQERVALYAQAGIWEDALTLLSELRLAKPKDTALASDWQDLLKSVGLEDVASETITQCCTPIQDLRTQVTF